MARLREPAPAEALAVEVPEEFTACYIEDWCAADDPEVAWLVSSNPRAGDDSATHGMARMVVARSRWDDARQEWAEAAGVDMTELPTGAPRWRHRDG